MTAICRHCNKPEREHREFESEFAVANVHLWYMRDNHTFRKLPLDIEGAIATMREEWEAGHTGGCLFVRPAPPSENPMRDSSGVTGSVHAGWDDFETRARVFIARALHDRECHGGTE